MDADFGAKLNALLSDPQMMAQIKSIADTMTSEKPPASEEKPSEEVAASAVPVAGIVPPSVEKNIKQMRALFVALKPFLDRKRCEKIDKLLGMMRLAEMAGAFRSFF